MDERVLERWMERLTSLQLEWELFAVDGRTISLEVREGELDSLKTSRNVGVALRLREEGRIGFSFSTSLDDTAVARMVEQARSAARVMQPNKFARFADPVPTLPALNLVDQLAPPTMEERIAAARRIEAAARAADPRVKRVRKASYSESAGREWLFNSHGVRYAADSTFYSASVLAVAEEGGESQSGGEFQFGRSFRAIDAEWIGLMAAQRAVAALRGRPVATASYNLVFENHVVADLLGVLAPSFLGESVQRNRSLLAGKLGEPVMAPVITLVDDGLDVRGAAANPFDGEGTPHQTTPVVVGGVLRTYLYDIETGLRDGRASTGNAGRAGFRNPPQPAPTNLRLEPGSGLLEDLCRDVHDGLLITDVLGVHTANSMSGDFSLGAAGFMIERGSIGRPVRGIAIADNVLGLFRRVIRVGADFRYFGSVGAASLSVPEVRVSGG